MNQLLSLLLFLATTPWRVSAAIGPGAQLEIVNRQIAPDGFKRSFVLHHLMRADPFTNNRSTVLAGGTFPGPLIQGTKVGVISKTVTGYSEYRSTF
jgi:iron transport multicopper oxidase